MRLASSDPEVPPWWIDARIQTVPNGFTIFAREEFLLSRFRLCEAQSSSAGLPVDWNTSGSAESAREPLFWCKFQKWECESYPDLLGTGHGKS